MRPKPESSRIISHLFTRNVLLAKHKPSPLVFVSLQTLRCAVQFCGSPFIPSEDINFHVTGSLAILLGETHLVTNLSFYLVTNRCNQESLIINCTNTTCCLSWQVLESCFLSPTLTGSPELLSALQKGCVWLTPKE